MSADNYFIIRLDKATGKFVPVMGFASDERTPKIRANHTRYDTVKEALDYAFGQYSEYGVSVHDECKEGYRTERVTDISSIAHDVLTSHYLNDEENSCVCGELSSGLPRDFIASHQSQQVALVLVPQV